MREVFKRADDLFGKKLFQIRAKKILPILVRQAKAGVPIYYGDLAQEVGMPNPRNLDYPLGCVGRVMDEVSKKWSSEIPHIQAIVVNQATSTPGKGFDGFLKDRGISWSNEIERKATIKKYHGEISAYPYWDDVLDELGLGKSVPNPPLRLGKMQGGGEGPEHAQLKKYVSRNPILVGIHATEITASIEYILPSGDSVDIVFKNKRVIHAVEVKSAISGISDIARGLFQCVKYIAVMRAQALYESDRRRISVCLALGGKFPEELIPLKNTLGIKVYDLISMKK